MRTTATVMIFAVSDVVWQALIGAVVTIVLAWMAQRTRNTVKETAATAAVKVEEVKTTLEVKTAEQNQKLEKVAEKVEEVHKATNSMKDQLVLKTEAEALARGGVEERARAEQRKNGA